MIKKQNLKLKCSEIVKTIKKENFPSKECQHCKRNVVWRKKWSKNWDQVKYCSEKCRRSKKIIE